MSDRGAEAASTRQIAGKLSPGSGRSGAWDSSVTVFSSVCVRSRVAVRRISVRCSRVRTATLSIRASCFLLHGAFAEPAAVSAPDATMRRLGRQRLGEGARGGSKATTAALAATSPATANFPIALAPLPTGVRGSRMARRRASK